MPDCTTWRIVCGVDLAPDAGEFDLAALLTVEDGQKLFSDHLMLALTDALHS